MGSQISTSAVIYAMNILFQSVNILDRIDVYFIPVVNGMSI